MKKIRTSPDFYPLSASQNQAGLTIVLKEDFLDPAQLACSAKTLVVHASTVLPSSFSRSNVRTIKYGYTYDFTITPEIMRSDKDLRNVKPAKRLCYFLGEKNLKYFKSYSQKNCEVECLSDYTYWACKCVAWYMIRNSTMNICVEKKIEIIVMSCVKKIEDVAFDSDRWFFNVKKMCKCYPSCDEFVYRERYRMKAHSR